MNQYRNLDILRAIAVLIVLGAHLSRYSILQQAIGHFAVLIFFVHTALVLLLSLERQSLTNGWVPRFYVQRVFRIYPLSIACVLLSLAFRIAWPLSIFEPRSTLSIGANLLLVQNLLHEQYSISAPEWSLPFEVQMYAVLPIVFWAIRKNHKQGTLLVLAAGFVVAIGERKLLHDGVWLARFVPCFLGGALAYAWRGAKRRISWWAWPCFIVVWGLLYGLYGFGIRAEMGGWLASLVLGILIPLVKDAPANWLSKAAALVARYSYGIYLSHVPLMWLCGNLTGVSNPLRWTLLLSLQCLVPVLLYHGFENPMIQAGKMVAARIGRREHSSAMAASASG